LVTFVIHNNMISCTKELPPLPEPYNAENILALKEILAEFKVVHGAIDEAVETVLNKVVEKVLKEH
jgi:hypothetical protein